jgi:hypothetical protein
VRAHERIDVGSAPVYLYNIGPPPARDEVSHVTTGPAQAPPDAAP